ncbi:MAG: exodeoxyribonuclease VII large subunit [Bacteroidetes bacterium]|nr:exodeoxyribonuclease VII large subunit [Bacteroidota bacterium]
MSDLFDSPILTVSGLTRQIKNVLETGFTSLRIEGEISNCRAQSSGHIYLTLKDEGAQLPAVIWRGSVPALRVRPVDGMKVVATGDLSVYEPHGKYQMVIRSLEPLGIGALQQAFEKLKQKLYAEGLFDPIHKKDLPPYPEKIGIVTSPTGAAVRDLISVITRRNPMVTIYVYPARVQGEGSAADVIAGLTYFNTTCPVDVIITGRGGGSLEDLWTFNEESVARTIFASEVPVISAVGHEIDFTIADFVADVRAATPSMAGELVVKERRELIEIILGYQSYLNDEIRSLVNNRKIRLDALRKSHALNRPADVIQQKLQRVDDLVGRMNLAAKGLIAARKQEITLKRQTLTAYNPRGVLDRGYAIISSGGHLVTHAGQTVPGQEISIGWANSEATAVITGADKKA